MFRWYNNLLYACKICSFCVKTRNKNPFFSTNKLQFSRLQLHRHHDTAMFQITVQTEIQNSNPNLKTTYQKQSFKYDNQNSVNITAQRTTAIQERWRVDHMQYGSTQKSKRTRFPSQTNQCFDVTPPKLQTPRRPRRSLQKVDNSKIEIKILKSNKINNKRVVLFLTEIFFELTTFLFCIIFVLISLTKNNLSFFLVRIYEISDEKIIIVQLHYFRIEKLLIN